MQTPFTPGRTKSECLRLIPPPLPPLSPSPFLLPLLPSSFPLPLPLPLRRPPVTPKTLKRSVRTCQACTPRANFSYKQRTKPSPACVRAKPVRLGLTSAINNGPNQARRAYVLSVGHALARASYSGRDHVGAHQDGRACSPDLCRGAR